MENVNGMLKGERQAQHPKFCRATRSRRAHSSQRWLLAIAHNIDLTKTDPLAANDTTR